MIQNKLIDADDDNFEDAVQDAAGSMDDIVMIKGTIERFVR